MKRKIRVVDAALNSANAILMAPLEALGLTPGAKFDFDVLAQDFYFTGAVTDARSARRSTRRPQTRSRCPRVGP